MARPDRAPGRDVASGPVVAPGRPHHPESPLRSQEGSVDRTIPSGADRSPDPRHVAAWLRLSDERDLWMRRVLQAWREGYQAALSDAVVESLLRIFPAPGHVSEIEKRRYPPDGRARFGDPRPGEYTGGPADFWGGRRRS